MPLATGIFVTALFGFGMKAGIMPLHIWLPSAHANAPSHISALMSGVLIKMGIYGLVRTLSFFGNVPLWWGAVVIVAGIVSGILGVAFAIAQHDIKRLLAYHSIENIGIIIMGLYLLSDVNIAHFTAVRRRSSSPVFPAASATGGQEQTLEQQEAGTAKPAGGGSMNGVARENSRSGLVGYFGCWRGGTQGGPENSIRYSLTSRGRS